MKTLTNKKLLSVLLAGTIAASASLGVFAKDKNSAEKITAFENSITATQAIQSATAQNDGQVNEVDFKFKNGESFYLVGTVKNGQETEIKVDSKTGQVIESKADGAKTLPSVAISITDAIAKAEAQTQGKAKDAELKTKNNQTFYVVETIAQGQKHKVKIDANSGDILETKTKS